MTSIDDRPAGPLRTAPPAAPPGQGAGSTADGRGGRGATARLGALALLWGSGFLWIKLALNGGMSPLLITFARCVLGAAVLYALARRAGQRLPRDRGTWGRLTVAALLCNAVPFALFAIGEQTVDSGVAGVLNATTPLWSLLIGVGLGTERDAHPVRLGGLLLGFAGTLLIFAPWHEAGLASWGALALVGAAVSYAVAFAYMGRALVGRGSGPLAMSAAQLAAASGLSALALPFGGTEAHIGPDAVAAVVVLGVFATGATFYLNFRLIADEGPTSAATAGYLLPVVSVALGALVLGEAVGARVVAGMAVVLAGVGMTRWRGRAAAPVPAAPVPAVSVPAAPDSAAPAGSRPLRIGRLLR